MEARNRESFPHTKGNMDSTSFQKTVSTIKPLIEHKLIHVMKKKKDIMSKNNFRSLPRLHLNGVTTLTLDFSQRDTLKIIERKCLLKIKNSFKSLSSLSLRFSSRNKWNENDLQTLCSCLKKLTNVTCLKINFSGDNHSIHDELLKKLLSVLRHMRALKNLAFGFDKSTSLVNNGKGKLELVLKSLKGLYSLDLNISYVRSEDFISLIRTLSSRKWKALFSLSLKIQSYFALEFDQGVIKLNEMIQRMRSLNVLKLIFKRGPGLNEFNFINLALALRKHKKLSELQLSFPYTEEITDDQLSLFSEILCSLQSLSKLNISLNHAKNITEAGISRLFNEIKDNLYLLSALNLDFDKWHFQYDQTKSDPLTYKYPKILLDFALEDLNWNYSNIKSLENISFVLKNNNKDSQNTTFLTLSSALKEMDSLHSVEFRFYPSIVLHQNNLQELFLSLRQKKSLKELTFNLSLNFSNDVIEMLEHSFIDFNSLPKLHLDISQYSMIPSQEISGLFSNLATMKLLQDLSLTLFCGSMVTDKSLTILAQSLNELKLLSQLSLIFKDGCFTDKGTGELLIGIKNLKPLLDLNLNFGITNINTGQTIKHLVSAIQDLPYLSKLIFSYNGHTGITDEDVDLLCLCLRERKLQSFSLTFSKEFLSEYAKNTLYLLRSSNLNRFVIFPKNKSNY